MSLASIAAAMPGASTMLTLGAPAAVSVLLYLMLAEPDQPIQSGILRRAAFTVLGLLP